MERKTTKQVGKQGEAAAYRYLTDKGMKLCETNFQTRWGEIDIIGYHKGYLVFVEVKLRKSNQFAEAKEFVDFYKQQRLRTTADYYLSQYPTNLQPRFDVIEIYAPQGTATKSPVIRHLEDAFI